MSGPRQQAPSPQSGRKEHMTMESPHSVPRSRSGALALLAGSLAALLGLRTQAANAAAPRPTRTPVPTPAHPPPATTPPVARPASATPTPARGVQREHWEYAVYALQTYTAARYQSFFTQLGAAGWELVGQSAYASLGSQAADVLLVTFKRPR